MPPRALHTPWAGAGLSVPIPSLPGQHGHQRCFDVLVELPWGSQAATRPSWLRLWGSLPVGQGARSCALCGFFCAPVGLFIVPPLRGGGAGRKGQPGSN